MKYKYKFDERSKKAAESGELGAVVWQSAAAVCERLEYIAGRLETIEISVDNIERRMPVDDDED